MMAEAAGKLTGKPGICFVTRGPGATNASPGIHIADQDSTPLILFVGQIERGMREREAFQELDYRAVFGTHDEMGDRDRRCRAHPRDHQPRLPCRDRRPARPGGDRAAGGRADRPRRRRRRASPIRSPRRTLPCSRPSTCRSGSGRRRRRSRSSAARAGTRRRSSASSASPSASTCRSRSPSAGRCCFPADHPNFAGDLGIGPNPKLLKRIQDSDLVLLVGGRLSEMPSQSYTLFGIPNPGRPLVHVHPDPEELGRVYRPSLAINASPTAFCAALETVHPPQADRLGRGGGRSA